MLTKSFGSLPLWQAAIVIGTAVAVAIYLVGAANKPKATV